MSEDRDDLILDACLDEVLGGQTPPDLACASCRHGRFGGARSWIIDPHRIQHSPPKGMPLDSQDAAALPPLDFKSLPTVTRSGQFEEPSVRVAPRRGSGKRISSSWSRIAIALSVAAAAGIGGVFLAVGYLRPPATAHRDSASTSPHQASKDNVVNGKPGVPRDEKLAAQNHADARDVDDPPVNAPDDSPFADQVPFRTASDPDATAPDGPAPSQVVSASPDPEVIAFINQAISQRWQQRKLTPAAAATDAEWCRRTYLRTLGRIPTVDELNRFVQDAAPHKRTELLDRLLTSDQYAAEYARNWTTFWTNVLIGRTGGTQPDELASREGLQEYLRRSITENKPYDRLVYELISATGGNRPDSEDFNGATNFLLSGISDDAALATARTCRVILGKQLQCVQCHDHPSNDWTQVQFWQMNAFFRQTHPDKDRASGIVRLVNEGRGEEAEVYYEQPNGLMKVAHPAFLDGTKLPRSALADSALAENADPRSELAKMMVRSDELSRTAVNRMWAHFLGFGFTQPVDDMGPHNPPSHPELLERLAGEFAAHGYDTKSLIRWIALSEPFGLSSEVATESLVDAPEIGEQPLFSRYYSRQMQPEEVYESLMLIAESNRAGASNFGQQEQARLAWLGQFSQNMGTDEGEETDHFNGSIRQSLIMMNGPLMQRAISREHSNLLGRVAKSDMLPRAKIEHLFLAAVARKPNQRELDLALKLYGQHEDDPAAALQDVWWALLNSSEFILDH